MFILKCLMGRKVCLHLKSRIGSLKDMFSSVRWSDKIDACVLKYS